VQRGLATVSEPVEQFTTQKGSALMRTNTRHHVIRRLFPAAIGMLLAAPFLFQVVTTAYSAEETKKAEQTVATSGARPAPPRLDLSQRLPRWTQQEVLGIPSFWRYVLGFAFILLGLVLKKISDAFFDKKLIPLLQKTRFAFDKLMATAASKPIGFLFLLGGVWRLASPGAPRCGSVRSRRPESPPGCRRALVSVPER
jgi:hypothetical protein